MISNPINASSSSLLQNDPAQTAARQIEAQFLVEMFKSAGVGKSLHSFDGGVGEEHFSSFLVAEYAQATVNAGGIGLAEIIYNNLVQEG